MKSIKRAPLLGGIGILIIILLLTTTIYLKKENTELKEINNSLNATTRKQTRAIENLKAED